MKNHFYISYSGNKREEVEEIYNKLNLDDITTIIEPFCGSCSLSYYIWLKHPNLKFILNDNDKNLKEMYEIMIDDDKKNQFEDLYYKKMVYIGRDKNKYLEVINNNDLIGWFIKNKIYCLKAGLFPIGDDLEKKLKNKTKINLCNFPIYEFFKLADIEFYNNDWLDIYKKYKNDEKNLILFDPPYINTVNSFYYDPKLNIYEYFFNNNIKDDEARLYFILEDIWIIKLLFRDFSCYSYNKSYNGYKKKKVKHIIISNTDLII